MYSPWPLILVVSWLAFGIQADGNVGCLLSKRVCGKHEWCYDDFAFGRCLSLYEEVSTDDLYRYGLEKEALKQLESEIRRLFTAGYRWAHSYTQCIVKKILRSFRYKVDFERNKCESKQDDDLERALTYLEAEHEIDPKDIAIIKFQPSLFDANADYGDELFFPSTRPEHILPEQDGSYVGVVKKYPGSPDTSDITEEQLTNSGEHHGHKSKSHNYERKKKDYREQNYNNKPLTDEEVMELLKLMSYANQDVTDQQEEFVLEDYNTDSDTNEPQGWSFSKHKNAEVFEDTPLYFSNNDEEYNQDNYRTDIDDTDSQNSFQVDPTIAFERPHRYDVKKPGPYFKVNNYVFEKEERENDENLSDKPSIFKYHPLFEEEDPSTASRRHQDINLPAEDFTAEGMSSSVKENEEPNVENETQLFPNTIKREDFIVKDDIPIYLSPDDEYLDVLLNNDYNDGNRNEAIFDQNYLDDSLVMPFNSDVDSDSPFSVSEWQKLKSNSEFKKGTKSKSVDGLELRKLPGDKLPTVITSKNLPPQSKSVTDAGKRKFSFHSNLVAPDMSDMKNSKPTLGHAGDSENYDVVDTSYAYVIIDKSFDDYKEAKEYAMTLRTLLDLPERTFSNIRQKDNKVIFKVKNSDGINAAIVASKAETIKDKLFERTGKRLVSAGIGDKAQLAVEELENDNHIFVITFIVCGVIAGAVIAIGVLYVVRRHARSREKLQNLTTLDTEASQDYQDLCRQRMASKTSEKPEPIHVAQRISSLSRDSETSVRSPSSRSSTSSWNEEPVISNMDISTGHMVLSYMEDHLTNKDRLDQEWVALCAYEADPSVVDAALQANNIKKNRYEDILPYDHSRVVLNDLTNIAGADYINASSITDHDPRNPAYIATQGPLPHTSADFWQMIWEQGSVVIVMLTRLVENGVAMCHRYWPEEGSELYHIYEVHLVSEHIWCEDYLVRSFYLKNLKTGETRTVTQFHFLSWPDNGVPNSTKALLDFRRKVNKSYRGRSCPIVVHCSDGIGRTGTYCLIDMVLNRMAKGAKEIDIAATLEHIRDQRTAMVRTKAQFEFALMAVAEEVHAILKAMPQ